MSEALRQLLGNEGLGAELLVFKSIRFRVLCEANGVMRIDLVRNARLGIAVNLRHRSVHRQGQ
jgi:hypothetical protein